MALTGRYLYGLTRAIGSGDFGSIGLEQAGQPGRVYPLNAGPVAAIVSEFPSGEKLLPLRKNLDPHHRVIREVMRASTIIPMTFGQVANSETEIVMALRENLDDILSALEQLDGKIEMGLKVLWDVDNIFEYFVREDPDLAGFRDQIFGRSRAPTQAEKVELGHRFHDKLAIQRERSTERVLAAFEPWVAEVKENPPKGERMVMNLAFLLDRDLEKKFDEKVCEVAKLFPGEYTFDFSGPWAPFNFVELDLQLTT